MLTKTQYTTLRKTHYEELNQEKKKQKVSVLSVYLDQADQVLQMINSITPDELADKDLLMRKLGQFDEEIDGFNDKIFPKIQNSQRALIELSFDQTKDYIKLTRSPITIKNGLIQDIITELQNPIPDAKFKLSTAIWGKDKRESIYKFVVNTSRMAKSPSEITNIIASHLDDSKVGGAFYKASRVVDTEFQRSYVNGLVDSTKFYNERSDLKLLLKRQLSPLHRVYDICDRLVGVYDPTEDHGDRPGYEVPSHPFCTCILSRIFVEDYSGEIRSLSEYRRLYETA